MTNRKVLVLIVLGVFGQTAFGQTALAQTQMEQVRAAWQRREQLIASARLSWTSTCTRPRGSVSNNLRDAGFKLPKNVSIPEEDRKSEGKGSLLIAGERFCLTVEYDAWSHSQNQFARSNVTSVFDNELHQVKRVSGGQTQINIFPSWERIRMNDIEIAGINYGIWPGDKLISRIGSELEVADQQVVVEGVDCIELREKTYHGNVKVIIVDPARDFAVLEHRFVVNGAIAYETKIEYQKKAGTWVPKSWSSRVRKSDGKSSTTYTSVVTSFTANPKFDPQEFTFEHPKDAIVSDEREFLNLEAKP